MTNWAVRVLRARTTSAIAIVLGMACLPLIQHAQAAAPVGSEAWILASLCGTHEPGSGLVLWGHCVWCYLAIGFFGVAVAGIGTNLAPRRVAR